MTTATPASARHARGERARRVPQHPQQERPAEAPDLRRRKEEPRRRAHEGRAHAWGLHQHQHQQGHHRAPRNVRQQHRPDQSGSAQRHQPHVRRRRHGEERGQGRHPRAAASQQRHRQYSHYACGRPRRRPPARLRQAHAAFLEHRGKPRPQTVVQQERPHRQHQHRPHVPDAQQPAEDLPPGHASCYLRPVAGGVRLSGQQPPRGHHRHEQAPVDRRNAPPRPGQRPHARRRHQRYGVPRDGSRRVRPRRHAALTPLEPQRHHLRRADGDDRPAHPEQRYRQQHRVEVHRQPPQHQR